MTKPLDTPPKPMIKPAAPLNLGTRVVDVPRTVRDQDTQPAVATPVKKVRADFRIEEFIRVIAQHGKHVVWRKALLCPCQSPESSQAQLSCALCDGGGYLYVDPLHIQCLMTMFDKRTSIYERFGIYQQGAVQVTALPQHRLGYRDAIEMLDAVIPFNELLTKGNRRGRRAALPEDCDSARFRIVDVAGLYYRCPDEEKLIPLAEKTHYTVTSEGWLRWTAVGDRAVPAGGQLTIHYDFHPVYLVASWLHVTRDDISGRKTLLPKATSLPVQAMAQLMWLTDVNVLPSMDPYVPKPSGFGREVPP